MPLSVGGLVVLVGVHIQTLATAVDLQQTHTQHVQGSRKESCVTGTAKPIFECLLSPARSKLLFPVFSSQARCRQANVPHANTRDIATCLMDDGWTPAFRSVQARLITCMRQFLGRCRCDATDGSIHPRMEAKGHHRHDLLKRAAGSRSEPSTAERGSQGAAEWAMRPPTSRRRLGKLRHTRLVRILGFQKQVP